MTSESEMVSNVLQFLTFLFSIILHYFFPSAGLFTLQMSKRYSVLFNHNVYFIFSDFLSPRNVIFNKHTYLFAKANSH